MRARSLMQNPGRSKFDLLAGIPADDEPTIQKILSRFLGLKGHEVVCFGDAESALAAIPGNPFDAVVLDNSLPGMMGITALPRIVRLTNAPVVMITGHPSEETHRDALLLGAKSFMAKPLDLEALAAKLAGSFEAAH